MCEPVSIAGLALSVAGTMAQMQGQRQAQKAASRVQSAETARQDQYQQEGMGYWQGALDRSGEPAQSEQLEEATKKREERYTGAVKDFDVNTDMLFGQGSAPAVVQNAVAGEVGSAIDEQRLEGLRKALLDAWGDSRLANAVANQRSGDKIGMVGRFARGSADILPLELQAAQSKGGGMRMFGDVLQAAGMVTGMAGGAGGLNALFGSQPVNLVGNMPKVAATAGGSGAGVPWSSNPFATLGGLY